MLPINNNFNNITPRTNQPTGVELFKKLMTDARAAQTHIPQNNIELNSANINNQNKNLKVPTNEELQTPPDISKGIRKGMVIDIKV